MKKLNLLLIALIISAGAIEQNWTPELTKQWEPVPEVVTPVKVHRRLRMQLSFSTEVIWTNG